MWWKRKKLERLFDELTAIALLDRLHASRTDLTQNDLDAYAMRQKRQSELLVKIGLNPTPQPIGKRAA
jgi:hypothetical protein